MKSICTGVLRMAAMLWAVSLGFSSPASAQVATNNTFKLGPADTVLRGDAKCTACHEDSDTPPPTMLGERPWILSIGKTKHGTVADGRTPTCSTCHGESAAHMKGSPDGKRPSPDRVYKKTTPAEVRNEACASCHKGGTHMFWTGSVHETRGTACTSCHDIHNNGHDKVRDKKTQAEVCYSCHKEQRAQMNRPSHHPVPEGKMSCSNCHAPHGSAAPKLLRKDSVNETCYECHMEKRGPFVHNHQPVTEDCSICHNPHGATAQTLLRQRLPLLCQNCHNAASHRTQAMQQLSGRSTSSGAIGSMARGCLNCHTNIHGSNSTSSSSSGGRFRQ